MPQMTTSDLESQLWEAANILRGPIDAADFKTYTFPLLFFKRISDLYDGEYEAALEESGGDIEYASFSGRHGSVAERTRVHDTILSRRRVRGHCRL